MSSSRSVAPTGAGAPARRLRAPAERWFAGLVVTVAMVSAVVAVDLILGAVAGAALGEQGAAILAAIGVTLAVAPFHERLTRALHRALTGRDDTFEIMWSLTDRLATATDEGGRLGDLVAVVAEGFAAPYAEVRLARRDGAFSVARHGDPRSDAEHIALEYRGSSLGELLVTPGRRLTKRDRVLLADLVRLAAAAFVTADTTDELQRIRTRLVLAREDERQRLRADLHDHLVPMLDTLSTRAAAARGADGVTARRELSEAVTVASAAVDDIRRVAQDLRPPALDDLGLGKALDQLAARYASRIPDLTLNAHLPGERPAAVEVAAYRIVADALAAVSRRAVAEPVEVSVGVEDGALVVQVAATGGLASGSGTADLAAQRERAEELGGTWSIDERGGITMITAVLPVAEEVAGVV
ncbi:MAG TPA: histidine kinase [Naasia sp.]|jgi:signal transduction histidine kinase